MDEHMSLWCGALWTRGGGECLRQVTVGLRRHCCDFSISLNRIPAGVSARHWGQINRALIRLNAPHFTASHSFAVKHCSVLPWGMSDWQALIVCVCIQSCLRAHLESIFYRYHHSSVSQFGHGVLCSLPLLCTLAALWKWIHHSHLRRNSPQAGFEYLMILFFISFI